MNCNQLATVTTETGLFVPVKPNLSVEVTEECRQSHDVPIKPTVGSQFVWWQLGESGVKYIDIDRSDS